MRSASQWVACALLVVLTLACLAPIRSYDFFWHLAAGRWIVEHRALPATDPFAVASDSHPWINGEWLFEVPLFLAWRLVGFAGLAWLRALLVGALFAGIYLLIRRSTSTPIALLLVCLSFAGVHQRLDVRPLTLAACFVAAAVAILLRGERTSNAIAYVILTILWMNTHPSALLAPVLAAIAQFRGERRLWLPFASAAALLINPFGLEGIVAPVRLTRFVSSGGFINAEWLPSDPRLFPLLYASIVIGAAAIASERKRSDMWRYILFAMFALMAVRSVRHQPLYFAALPMLIAPSFAAAAGRRERLMIGVSGALIAMVALTTTHQAGVDDARFPLHATQRLKASGLRGNIYNPDQFGGLLIWAFYPERRVLTDGRNELYQRFLPEYARARVDSRAWRALLARYRIDLAVDEYRPPLEVIDARTGAKRFMPASLAYFPRNEWAVIAYDRAGMAFARRAAFDDATIGRLELKGVVPDAR
ncbi:MAG TPA: hypothetical protein VFL80_10415 [Thermoanaerobaculia bacterium]|nr:hypothetical protein [Thermoanaerobaculia bacterium]